MAKIVNAQPPKFEWRVYRNDSANLTVAALDDEGKPFDLSLYELTGMVREDPNSEDPISTLEITVQDNIITVSLDTTTLPTISYFDIQSFSLDNGNTKTILYGTIFLEEDITW
jgi:hypothetical protein